MGLWTPWLLLLCSDISLNKILLVLIEFRTLSILSFYFPRHSAFPASTTYPCLELAVSHGLSVSWKMLASLLPSFLLFSQWNPIQIPLVFSSWGNISRRKMDTRSLLLFGLVCEFWCLQALFVKKFLVKIVEKINHAMHHVTFIRIFFSFFSEVWKPKSGILKCEKSRGWVTDGPEWAEPYRLDCLSEPGRTILKHLGKLLIGFRVSI